MQTLFQPVLVYDNPLAVVGTRIDQSLVGPPGLTIVCQEVGHEYAHEVGHALT